MLDANAVQGPELRVLVTPICQLRCTFCHNEGQPGEQNTWKGNSLIALRRVTYFSSDKVDEVLLPIKRALGVSRVHLSGGEPTLHPDIVGVVKRCREHFQVVKMTTNGVFSPELLGQLSEVLSSLVFSIHATSWERFQQIQGRHLPDARAEDYFTQQMGSVLLARDLGIPFKLNSVVLEKETTLENIEFANRLGIEIRLLRDLGNPYFSEQIIQSIIREGDFCLEDRQMGFADSSGYREIYSNSHQVRFTVKRIQEVYLDGMCNQCPIIAQCKERFYGIRVEPDGRVRLCVHRDDPGVLLSVDEFLNGPLSSAVRRAYYSQGDPL
ncbi:MAG: radical SAM protein [bacterium]|nr:radical SAM protein [bacterium]